MLIRDKLQIHFPSTTASMNSPPDPGTPTDSASTSDTPPPEEIHSGSAQADSRSSGLGLFQLANQITASLSGSAKRRNPSGGSTGATTSTRETKQRRRGGESSRYTMETRGDAMTSRKEKEDLADANIVDYLRKGMLLARPFFIVFLPLYHRNRRPLHRNHGPFLNTRFIVCVALLQ